MKMITEDQLEQHCIDWFKEIGWEYECGYDIAPDTNRPFRTDYQEVVILDRLRESLARINPNIPTDKIDEAINMLTRLDSTNLEVNNRQFHRFVNSGVPIDIKVDGRLKRDFVKLIDF